MLELLNFDQQQLSKDLVLNHVRVLFTKEDGHPGVFVHPGVTVHRNL